MPDKRRISVIGLGYVGLPVAVAFARAGFDVTGFDINADRIAELRAGHDRTREVPDAELEASTIRFTGDADDLARADFHIVTVPTPITPGKQPDLTPLMAASRTVGKILKKGDIVVYESTVYPGATEEDCIPVLEKESGLAADRDFGIGYSPERINPGDRTHRFESITKVVSGSTPIVLDIVARTYGAVVAAGIHQAPSIKVAEAAKVIENTQRDLNIALMNELAMIFARMGIRSRDVLAAAATKWNFMPFSPGLVGGHCIGVDPYYLTAKAEALGFRPEVILAGRRTNDGMGAYIAGEVVKALVRSGRIGEARIGILGITFKENVPDLRNSRVPDIIRALSEYGLTTMIHDPLAEPAQVTREYGLTLCKLERLTEIDALIVAVPHRVYRDMGARKLTTLLREGGVIFDIRSCLDPEEIVGHEYRCL
ncbi:nucleotide sugar dehydrogenase [Saliniramus fredricksonii]|uniref:UDP-N-acetyl-D-galactosamine dehydrogenase n=1 Tax=Saliniramus fredricksonii TaxID=1653334 RepID=A0ABY0K6C5_9HYPH|nr:nucleotide sugar dehydrogenase [Saliniramus fredricksonii]SCC79424.1 UDP-N-acetyl-D-galactosamine dehydrogenase [Saliniramus fredricksonii]